ncbi:MAG: hypothetical protein IAE95_06625 [Chitinophagaceae bacterium]|nr:hypothetical protein [Chitinophagaceae bacterium]
MKKIIDSFTSFTRPERAGLVILSGILLVLVGIRTTMSLWVRPVTNKEKEAEMVKAWADYRRSHDPSQVKINLYTADSATIVKIDGIGPKLTHDILKLRRLNKLTDMNSLNTVFMDESRLEQVSQYAYVDTNEKDN